MVSTIYVVSYLTYDEFGTVEWVADRAFRLIGDAEQYIKEQKGSDPTHVAYLINEVEFEDLNQL